MAEINTITNELQQQVLDGIRKGQDAVVEAVRAWADAVQHLTPNLPTLPTFDDTLPKAEELVAQSYDFAADALANQRAFAENLLKAAEPLIGAKG